MIQYGIELYRRKAGITSKHLAESVGVSRTSMLRYEHGGSRVKKENATKIAHVLGVELSKLKSVSKEELDSYKEEVGSKRIRELKKDGLKLLSDTEKKEATAVILMLMEMKNIHRTGRPNIDFMALRRAWDGYRMKIYIDDELYYER